MKARFSLLFLAVATFLSVAANAKESEKKWHASAAPDYALPSSWAASADKEGLAAVIPPGSADRTAIRSVDVFYIHPTTDRSRDYYNQDIRNSQVNIWTDESAIRRQASIFNICCRMFAPRYRQATIGAAYAEVAVRKQAFSLAYDDVRRSFDYFVEHLSGGRPFLLVGHSQGAAHLARLLAEEIDGSPISERLVAAYVVGIGFPAAAFDGKGSSLSVCEKPDSTGCVVHWNSVLPGSDIAAMASYSEDANRREYPAHAEPSVLCINPLTFDRSIRAASADSARGAVPGTPDQQIIRAIVPAAVSAHCERGFLIVEPDAALGMSPLPGGSMHYHDFGLFYEDVRQNVQLRARAFLAAHPQYGPHSQRKGMKP